MKSRTLRFLSLTLLAVLALAVACAATGHFTATGRMEFARRRHTATRLANGRVLIAGGANGTGTLATAELFNPATGTFTRTGNMRIARAGHRATLLANGKVLVTGGTNSTGTLATAELFNPATGTFTRTGNMATPRVGHTATLLGNGKVLVAGGGTAKAELFNPSTGVFTSTKPMIAARMGHIATLLKNGKVLLAGARRSMVPLWEICLTPQLPRFRQRRQEGPKPFGLRRHCSRMVGCSSRVVNSRRLSAAPQIPLRSEFLRPGNLV